MRRIDVPGLATLARLFGVQASFYDVDGRRQTVPAEALLSVLRALGAPVDSFADVTSAIRARRSEVWYRGVEPVTVAWQGEPASVELRVPDGRAAAAVRCELALEGGERRRWNGDCRRLPALETAEVEGVRFRRLGLSLPRGLPCGYHRLTVQVGERRLETLVISAPGSAYASGEGRSWGVFLPLYAVRSERDWGVGDLTDLGSLAGWTAGLGGSAVGTLPLLAAFLDEPFAASPYTPASRLFWNELYVDVTAIWELKSCPPARAVLTSPDFQRDIEAQRSQPLVDYRSVMALKRRVLEKLAACFFAGPSPRRDDFERFLEANPLVENYARFRAVGERRRAAWPAWSEREREGDLRPGDYDEAARRYHMYVQWVFEAQMDAVSESARREGVGLCLDLPLGVSPDGYDVWRERALFAQDVSAGAPPDTFFSEGQDWGMRPPNPEEQRRQGYRHFIACLRHQLRCASTLRIDHVMGLHRLYWVLRGASAREGAYVRYPAEELYVILCLESRRHEAVIVGEDLGTVPGYVRKAMRRHGLQRSYVVQLDERTTPERPLGPVSRASVASLNTHDTPTFAAYWRDLDPSFRRGLLSVLRRKGFLDAGRDDPPSVLRALLRHLAAGAARTAMVDLEDLWLEPEPQNVPGTTDEYPNWRRKARYALEELSRMPEVVDLLREVERARKRKVLRVSAG